MLTLDKRKLSFLGVLFSKRNEEDCQTLAQEKVSCRGSSETVGSLLLEAHSDHFWRLGLICQSSGQPGVGPSEDQKWITEDAQKNFRREDPELSLVLDFKLSIQKEKWGDDQKS